MKKIALFYNDAFSMYHFRKDLIKDLLKKGCLVTVIFPPDRKYEQKLHELGVNIITIKFTRFFSPIYDLKLLLALYRIFKKNKFDIVHNMTIKPNIYGSITARLTRIKRSVCLVSGAGFLFNKDENSFSTIVKKPIKMLYKFGLRMSDMVWFQNPDDLELFINEGLIQRNKCLCIKSGGINIDEYDSKKISIKKVNALKTEFGIKNNQKIVLMVAARMIWSKGVKEFIEAAKLFSKSSTNCLFILISPKDNSPDSVPDDYIKNNSSTNLKVINEFRTDIKYFIQLSDVVTLPSYYREGVPRFLLEALSLGKPIVTTNNVGCKEVIDEDRNGFLIAPKNSRQLTEKIKILLQSPKLSSRFGKVSREKAMKEFDSKIIVKKIYEELYKLD